MDIHCHSVHISLTAERMGGPSGGADIGEIQRKYLPTKKLAAKLSAVEGGKNRRKRGEFLGRHLHLILDPSLFLPSFFSLSLLIWIIILSGTVKVQPSAVRDCAKSEPALSETAQIRTWCCPVLRQVRTSAVRDSAKFFERARWKKFLSGRTLNSFLFC